MRIVLLFLLLNWAVFLNVLGYFLAIYRITSRACIRLFEGRILVINSRLLLLYNGLYRKFQTTRKLYLCKWYFRAGFAFLPISLGRERCLVCQRSFCRTPLWRTKANQEICDILCRWRGYMVNRTFSVDHYISNATGNVGRICRFY